MWSPQSQGQGKFEIQSREESTAKDSVGRLQGAFACEGIVLRCGSAWLWAAFGARWSGTVGLKF